MNRYIIVGSGVAGMAAAEAIRTSERAAEITLVSEDPHGFYSRPGLAYYLTGELPEKQLSIYTKEDWLRLNVRFVPARATCLLPQEHRLELGQLGALTYDRLLLAVGATAARLAVPGADLQGVIYLDNLEDTRRLLQMARRERTAVVVGGGITALELAEGLAARKAHVHYLLRGDRYWPSVLDETESRIVEHRLAHDGIRLHHQTELAEVLGRNGKVTGIRTARGETLACQLVAAAIGTKPRLELAQAAGLETQRGILVNEQMQTSAADIFAAGDCAQVLDPLTGQWVLETLWNSAREQGRAAGLNMAGVPTVYRHTASLNVTRLAGLTVTLIGALGGGRDDDLVTIARGDSEAWRAGPGGVSLHQTADVNRLRLLMGERTLLGALLMGDQTLSLPLQYLVAAQADIRPIREQLLDPQAALGELLAGFWQASKEN